MLIDIHLLLWCEIFIKIPFFEEDLHHVWSVWKVIIWLGQTHDIENGRCGFKCGAPHRWVEQGQLKPVAVCCTCDVLQSSYRSYLSGFTFQLAVLSYFSTMQFVINILS